MKFTNGYWLMKENIEPLYAIEYADHKVNDHELIVYAPGKHIASRGDTLNLGMLTVRITSPIENVIKVSVSHFEGTDDHTSYLVSDKKYGTVEENDDEVIFRSGRTGVVISKKENAWAMQFMDGDKVITTTSTHNMARMMDRDTKTSYMVEQLAVDVDETLYGFGERFTPFVKNGQSIDNWNSDGGTASEQSYKCVPFYLSSKGYGVLVDSESDVAFEVCSEKVEYVQFSKTGESLSYYLFDGKDVKDTLRLYGELCGKPALPPSWSFGLWLSTSFTTDYDEGTTSSFLDGMKERDIPVHVFHFDCFWMEGFEWCNFTWDNNQFPDPKGMLERYHARGLKICVWINPYIAQKSDLFHEAKEHGYLVKKTDGSVWQTDLWQAGMGLVDFTNPDACTWFEGKLKKLLDDGVDCFKTDFGERIPVKDIAYFDGSDPVSMHNHYTYLYNRCVFDLLKREKGEKEAVVFARSATTQCQQFPVHWGGDCFASYSSMAETLRGGLSLASCGFGFWSHDIGGFESTASADVYKRWIQFGLLSSHSRLHGSSSYRVPWLFDEEACDVLKKFVNLKCRLMPYLYKEAVHTHETGVPMMRPLFMEYDDPTVKYIDKQYMMGDSLMVAPIFQETGEVQYYLPDGKWFNILTEKEYEGSRWIRETYDYMHLPLLMKDGSIIVAGNNETDALYDYTDDLTLFVYLSEEGMKTTCDLVNEKGDHIGTVHAERKDGQLIVKATGITNYKIKDIGRE